MEDNFEREATLLTMDEVKKILKVGTNKVYELVAQKRIPSIKLGKSIRVPKKALLEWIEKETVEQQIVDDRLGLLSAADLISRNRQRR